MENRSQSSLEFLMVFSIGILFLIFFTIPLANLAISTSLDFSNSLNNKYEISKIADGINIVGVEGEGSQKTVVLNLNKECYLNIGGNKLKSSIGLNNNESKEIILEFNGNVFNQGFNLNSGKNLVLIKWPYNSNQILVQKI